MATVPINKAIIITRTKTVEEQASYNEVEYVGVFDDAKAKTVRCSYEVGGRRESVILWEGASYDAAGQYTDVEAQARLAELLNA